ncbi:hypothetical protein LLH06_13025 [Mucilaginibacter daejeonensis]|uniref:hypothetical protein n=1 Tax=Mucilaginibacter daejeonensis TaxID=398049 RepID=UPI001D173827|nr:hypothetical protein [Mucilaginibacter daejeonensis]UEG51885.1 hypothetical protein LLH06_13025 [Mucilaginibacter daejeonensis]
MDVLKLSTDWAKAEIVSARLVLLFGVLIFLVAIGFWQFGRTGTARAFIIPLFIAGILVVAVSAGLYLANKPRLIQFRDEYQKDQQAFMQKELARTFKSQQDFKMVFKALPAIIIVAALIIVFVPGSIWRASATVTILLMAFLMLVDSQTEARNNAYRQELLNVKP